MYESTHCFRIDVGSSSYPDAEFFIADMIVLTSFTCTSGIAIHLSVLCTYSKGLLLEWILLANELPTFIKYMLKALAITLISDIY